MGTTTHKAASIEDSTRIDPFNLEEFNVSEVVRDIHAELKAEFRFSSFENVFLVWLRNLLISIGLEPVLRNTEKHL